MSYATYKDIEKALANRETFRGNSIRGERIANSYFVYSYNTLILNMLDDEVCYFNEEKYSTTTSRLQNLIRKVIL